ncbi:MAG TPA: hypothetical protein VJQ44_18335 [Gemmatimonadales bacterium]|nr:hypothetical protein [Gemmatimonadales bacterium]
MTARTIACFASIALLVGCGGDSSGPDNTDGGGGGNGPPSGADVATVVVVDGDLAQGSEHQTVTLHLQNVGPAGAYRLQFWGKPTTAGGPDSFLGDTEPLEVTGDYDAEVSYDLSPEPAAAFVVVFTRDDATSTKFLQTDRFDF